MSYVIPKFLHVRTMWRFWTSTSFVLTCRRSRSLCCLWRIFSLSSSLISGGLAEAGIVTEESLGYCAGIGDRTIATANKNETGSGETTWLTHPSIALSVRMRHECRLCLLTLKANTGYNAFFLFGRSRYTLLGNRRCINRFLCLINHKNTR